MVDKIIVKQTWFSLLREEKQEVSLGLTPKELVIQINSIFICSGPVSKISLFYLFRITSKMRA